MFLKNYEEWDVFEIFIAKIQKLSSKYKSVTYYLGVPINSQLWNNNSK